MFLRVFCALYMGQIKSVFYFIFTRPQVLYNKAVRFERSLMYVLIVATPKYNNNYIYESKPM